MTSVHSAHSLGMEGKKEGKEAGKEGGAGKGREDILAITIEM